MSLQTSADITVLVISENSSSERRINPSWTLEHLKDRLLPVTGIPPSSQRLTLRLAHVPQPIAVAAADEATTQVAAFPFQAYAELHVRLHHHHRITNHNTSPAPPPRALLSSHLYIHPTAANKNTFSTTKKQKKQTVLIISL